MQSYLFCLVLNNFIFNLGLQRRIRHESPFALYVNCRNHRLALCLVHLIKKYPVLQEIDSLLISLWKQQDGFLISMHVQDLYQGNFKFIRVFLNKLKGGKNLFNTFKN